MTDPCKEYKLQYIKIKEILGTLEKEREEIEFKLNSEPVSPSLNKELRTINLDIKITENELEHLESCIEDCELKHNPS